MVPTTPSFRERIAGLVTRMTGYPAGLPQGTIVDPTGRDTAASQQVSRGAIPLRSESPADYTRNGSTVRTRGFERHPVVMACVRAITDVASAVPIQFYKEQVRRGGHREVTVMPTKFDGQQLIDSPSMFLSSQRLRALTFVHYLIYGNGLWFLERPTQTGVTPGVLGPPPAPPTGIRMIHPEDLLSVYVNDKGYPIWYMWRDPLGYPHTSPVTDIMHFRDLSAKGLVFGYPRAASALNDIIGDDEASQHVRQVVTNAGIPSAVALLEEEVDAGDAKAAEEAWYEKMVRRGQRGRFAFMGGVKDVKVLGFNLKDLEFPDLRRVAREDICAAFGVDPRMVGITSASKDAGLSGTQYAEARVRLIQQTIEPMLRAFESEFNLWLAPEFGDVYMRFDPDALAALVEDDDVTSTRITREVQAGLRSIEQGRDVLDIEEPADTDTLIIPSTLVVSPIAIAMNPPVPEPTPPGGGTPGAAGAAGSNGDGTLPNDAGNNTPKGKEAGTNTSGAATQSNPNSDTPSRPSNGSGDDINDDKKKRAAVSGLVHRRSVVLSPEQRQMLWSAFDQRAANEEAPFRRTALMLFGEERAHVARTLDAQQANEPATGIKTLKRQLKQTYKVGGEARSRWVERMTPLITTVYAKGAQHVLDGIKTSRSQVRADDPNPKAKPSLSFSLHDPDVRKAIQDRATKLADYVGQTTSDAITGALDVALAQGMSMKETASLVDKVAFGGSAGYRATMISRTESIGALNQGQFDSAMMSEAVSGKEWLTQGDDRVRDSHMECEEEGRIPLDQEFSNGLQHPGDQDGDEEEVINCRCTLLYYDDMGEGAERSEMRAMRHAAEHTASRIEGVAGDVARLASSVEAIRNAPPPPAPVVNVAAPVAPNVQVDVHIPRPGKLTAARDAATGVIAINEEPNGS